MRKQKTEMTERDIEILSLKWVRPGRLGDDAKDQFFLLSLRPIKSWMKAASFWSWEAAS